MIGSTTSARLKGHFGLLAEERAALRIPLFSALLLAVSATSALASSLTCRFESVEDLAGRDRTTGTVVRTATAVIVEYDSGTWTQTFICPRSVYACEGEKNGIRTDVDFSYPGFMIIVTHYTAVGMTSVGLARIECQ